MQDLNRGSIFKPIRYFRKWNRLPFKFMVAIGKKFYVPAANKRMATDCRKLFFYTPVPIICMPAAKIRRAESGFFKIIIKRPYRRRAACSYFMRGLASGAVKIIFRCIGVNRITRRIDYMNRSEFHYKTISGRIVTSDTSPHCFE